MTLKTGSVAKQMAPVGQLMPVKPVAAPMFAGRLQVVPLVVLMKLDPVVVEKHAMVLAQLIALRV
jgi:hypothetical protein